VCERAAPSPSTAHRSLPFGAPWRSPHETVSGDELKGGANGDELRGGAGGNELRGGTGRDELRGAVSTSALLACRAAAPQELPPPPDFTPPRRLLPAA
jgi:hypothetical protein